MLANPPASTLADDFLKFLRASFDATDGASGPHADVSLQPRGDVAPVKAHAVVLLARCSHLAALISAAASAAQTRPLILRVDCERDELLGVLGWIYLETLPTGPTTSLLLRLRELASTWALTTLDVAASAALVQSLDPSLCCELLREISREEARARLAEAATSPTCIALREACGAHAASVGLPALSGCEAFGKLPSAQQTYLFAKCFDPHPLHALALADSVPAALDREALLHALLAPPHSCELDSPAQPPAEGDFERKFATRSTPLQVALTQRNWDAACLLLDAGASPHPTSLPKQRSLLHAHAESGDAQACSFLAQRGAAISACDADGYSPLDLAVLHEQAGAATAIREHGGVSTFSDLGNSLVHHLAEIGRATALAILVSAETVDVPNQKGLAPLHIATLNGHTEAVTTLLGARADLHKMAPSSSDGNGGNTSGTALHLACRRGDSALVELLLENGANTTSKVGDGCTPLHLGATDPPTAKMLLIAAAAVDEKDGAGRTPLHHAVANAPPPVLADSCRVLLEGGARANTTEFLQQQTPLHNLCERGGGGEALDALDALIAHGATVNAQDKKGFTPLHLAAFRGHEHLALALAAAGASLNVPSYDGTCALSSRPPHPDILKDAKPVSVALRAGMIARIAQPLPWLPDNMSETCQVCYVAFSNSNRRHHCRHCGRIVCAKCSPKTMAIPKFQVTKPTRVCAECEPVLELHGKRALGPPGVGGMQISRQAETTVNKHLDHVLAAKNEPPSAAPPQPPPPQALMPPPQAPAAANPFGVDDTTTTTTAAANPFGDGPAPAERTASVIGLLNNGTPTVPPPPVPPSAANPFDDASAGAPPPPPPLPPATTRAESNPFGAAAESNPFGEAEVEPVTPVRVERRGSANPFEGVSSISLAANDAPNPFEDSDEEGPP